MSSALSQSRWNDLRQACRRYLQDSLATARQFSPWVLGVPLLAVAAVIFDARTGQEWFEEKSTQEILAPSILATAVFVALLFWARAGDFYSRWLVLLSGSLFCRELHFWGTNNGIYLAVLLLIWYGLRNFESMRPFQASRTSVSLFLGALLTYALTKTLDRGYWKFLAGWTNWQDSMEESLESTAHLMILALVVQSYMGWETRLKCGIVTQTSLFRRIGVWAVAAAGVIATVFTFPHWHGEHEPVSRHTSGFPLELSAVCPVDSTLGENLFLASSDEDHRLTLWTLADVPTPLKQLELTVSLPDGSSVHLDDIEEITADGHGAYYAVSSHRHLLPEEDASRQKKSHGTECALVRFELAESDKGIVVANARLVSNNLLHKIHDLGVFPSIDWKTSKTFSWRGLVKTWQLNIEGLAYVDGKVLLGFKDPIEAGRATILSYDPDTDQLEVAARPDLGGHGILGLHYDSSHHRLLLLSNNPIKHRFGDSCLWVGSRGAGTDQWVFSRDHRYVIEPASARTHRKASGLLAQDGRLVVCFDSETEAPIKVLAAENFQITR